MTISKSTFKFLKDIEKNNNREWFAENKPRYEEAWKEAKAFAAAIEEGLSKKDVIEKTKVFRIYRDVRFAKNKEPYKSTIGIGFTRAGANRRGGYYLHIEPGNTFAGGGFWAPNPTDLKRIRDEFHMDAKPIRKIIKAKKFKEYFGDIYGDEVKTAPKGFSKEDPNIDLIRKKQFIVTRQFSDQDALDANFHKEVVKTYVAMLPYFNYMTEVLTTNLNGESLLD